MARNMACVLVVEDEATVLKNIARSLNRAGFDAVTAMSCEEAWMAFSSNKVDAICLDILLPDGNGLDLLERIRPIAPDLPVVVISSLTCSKTRLRASQLGVRHFLPKPFSLAGLKEALAKCFVSV